MILRAVAPEDFAPLVRLWHDVWHETHARFVPDALVRLRTPEDFAVRFPPTAARTRVAGPVGAPLGFCTVDGDEIDQLYIAPQARGTGLAAVLLADGEARLAAAGVCTAVLLCIPQNARARAFYGRSGWCEGPLAPNPVKTAQGQFDLPTLTFSKPLR